MPVAPSDAAEISGMEVSGRVASSDTAWDGWAVRLQRF